MVDRPERKPIEAEILRVQPVSVTRQMAAAFPRLKDMAKERGMKLHHLGAGYPHPEVSDPTGYIAHRDAYFAHLATQQDSSKPTEALTAMLREMYSYGDTMGPSTARAAFAKVYGRDFGFEIDPECVIPTMGATGGISLLCSLFERTGHDIAYIVDAPTYTGFVSRAKLYQRASFYSVVMDEDGAHPDDLRRQIREARADRRFVAFYYTVPDGHNPGGISFSQARRDALLDVVREEGILIVEDAPYTYISYETAENRPRLFVAMDPDFAVHLFTASKIGLPGPRVGFMLIAGRALVRGGVEKSLKDLVVVESAGDLLFHNPEALRAFEAYLMDERFEARESLWPIAAKKNAVYGENRRILLDGLQSYLGEFPDHFSWTRPGAGFFSVFTFKKSGVRVDQSFVEHLVANYGVVTIPMFGFYPEDARQRNPDIGLDQMRLSFSFNEGFGEERRRDIEEATRAFANAARIEAGLPRLSQ